MNMSVKQRKRIDATLSVSEIRLLMRETVGRRDLEEYLRLEDLLDARAAGKAPGAPSTTWQRDKDPKDMTIAELQAEMAELEALQPPHLRGRAETEPLAVISDFDGGLKEHERNDRVGSLRIEKERLCLEHEERISRIDVRIAKLEAWTYASRDDEPAFEEDDES